MISNPVLELGLKKKPTSLLLAYLVKCFYIDVFRYLGYGGGGPGTANPLALSKFPFNKSAHDIGLL